MSAAARLPRLPAPAPAAAPTGSAPSVRTGILVPPGRRVTGVLDTWLESGSEGVRWILRLDPARPDAEAWYPLHDGDELTIWAADGTVHWRGTLALDRDVGRRPAPWNPAVLRQVALGATVHGVQEGLDPDDWARYFWHAMGRRGAGLPVWRATLHLGPAWDVWADPGAAGPALAAGE